MTEDGLLKAERLCAFLEDEEWIDKSECRETGGDFHVAEFNYDIQESEYEMSSVFTFKDNGEVSSFTLRMGRTIDMMDEGQMNAIESEWERVAERTLREVDLSDVDAESYIAHWGELGEPRPHLNYDGKQKDIDVSVAKLLDFTEALRNNYMDALGHMHLSEKEDEG